MRSRYLMSGGVGLILALAAPGSLSAQICSVCDTGEPEYHHFHTWECESGANCYSCTEGAPGNAGCHTDDLLGSCNEWHAHCGITLLAEVIEGYRTGDISTSLGLVAQEPASWSLNSARSALQAVDCTGRVVAHLPLTADEFRVAAALPLTGRQADAARGEG